jgi:PKD repeat protein
MSAGKTWKSYAEDLPSIGYTGGDTGNYLVRHNPFAYFTDVQNSTSEKMNLVPFTQFATDLANNTLPNYSFIVPNKCNDAHDCSLSTADNWLKKYIAPLISSTTFQQDGMLIILFDEAGTDNTNGGGRIAWVVVSPKAKQKFQSTTFYQHASTLRLTMEALGMTYNLAAASTAPAMGEFFVTTTPTTTPTALLTVSPNSGTAPLAVTADSSGSTDSGGSITSRAFNFGDGSSVVNTTSLTASHTYNSAGTYTVTLTITDSSGKTATATQQVSVTAPPTTPTPSPTAVLAVSPQTGLAPLAVTADSSQSNEPGGSIVSRSFNFGDGTPAVTGAVSTSHTYATGGKYTVTLTVTDGAGMSATATQGVLVKRHGKIH